MICTAASRGYDPDQQEAPMTRRTGRSGQGFGSSRRDLLRAGAVLVASAPALPGAAAAQGLERADARTVDRLVRQSADPNRRILVKGGTIVSLDHQVGDL